MNADPELIVDAHQHFWNPLRASYPWMTGSFEALRRLYGPTDLAPELAASGVDATVVVQARQDLEETRELLDVALATDWVSGVVGWVDLTDPGVPDIIASLREGAAGGFLAGVRHLVHDEPDPRWLLRPNVLRGLRAVADAGLTYDLLVRTRELPAALEVARSVPQLTFVIDHLAKPPIATGEHEPWLSELRGFRRLDNVVCKVSGLVTEARWDAWQPHHLRPWVEDALEVFGSDRLLFGSDWPVCTLAATYAEVFETTKEILRDLVGSELGSCLGGCALRAYRLVERRNSLADPPA